MKNGLSTKVIFCPTMRPYIGIDKRNMKRKITLYKTLIRIINENISHDDYFSFGSKFTSIDATIKFDFSIIIINNKNSFP